MAHTFCFDVYPKKGKVNKMRSVLVDIHGFPDKQNHNGSYFYTEVPADDAWQIQLILKTRKYKFRRYDKRYARGTSYRKDFFKLNPGPYRCAYCGRRLKEDDVEVDHLIPVSKAKSEFKVRALLQMCGISNVNDPKNLVAACHKCNSRKSDNMGVWVVKGVIGRHKKIWIVRNLFRVILWGIILYLAFVKFDLLSYILNILS